MSQINGGYVDGNQGSFANINSMNSSTIKNVNSSNINPNTMSTTNNNANASVVYPQQQYINQQGVGQYNRNFVQNGNNIPNIGQVQRSNQQVVGQILNIYSLMVYLFGLMLVKKVGEIC